MPKTLDAEPETDFNKMAIQGHYIYVGSRQKMTDMDT